MSPPCKKGSSQSPSGVDRQPSQDENISEEDIFCDFQMFDEHFDQAQRFRKTLYYGELPWYTERPSLALTSLALEFFTKSMPPRDELRYLDMEYASRVVKRACVTPASVVVALLYADRLRHENPHYMAQTNSCDLFLVSLMVASKFLYDDGVDDEVYNAEWAKAADLEVKEINREERHFLNAIQWKLMVQPKEFSLVVANLERRIAVRELSKRRSSSSTYTELDVLTNQSRLQSKIYAALYDYVLKVVTVSMMSYCACLLTVFASVAAVQLVFPVAKPPRETSSYGNSSLSPSGLDSPAYSGLLLDHQKELEVILRGEQLEIENSTATMSCIRDNGVAEFLSKNRFNEFVSIEIRPWEVLKQLKISTQYGVLPNDVFPFTREPRIEVS